ncbi:MAG: serine--tRNA ligase [Patescibacteria group bacterium]
MIDIKDLRENPQIFFKAVEDKQLKGTVDLEALLELDKKYLTLLPKVESHRALRNQLSTDISKLTDEAARKKLIDEATQVKNELATQEEDLKKLKTQIDAALLWVPNPPAADVPFGEGEEGNVEVKKGGTIPQFDFEPKDHLDLGKALDIIDTDRGTKIAGFRGYFLKNGGLELHHALLRYALDLIKQKGFDIFEVPWMVNPEYFTGTGYFPWGEDDHYVTQDGKALIGTAEVALTSYYADEILEESQLPIKLAGISPCYRREIGSYGKDTKGIFRVHQFTKVEQVVLTVADEDKTRELHDTMLGYAEELLQGLGLAYHVLLMCTGDMGAGQRRKYDVETWFPSQNTYRETHSDSYFNDFQARRLNIRYRTKDGELKYVYTLNNTVAASPRLLAAVIENYQQKDGSIVVPEVLHKYTDLRIIK